MSKDNAAEEPHTSQDGGPADLSKRAIGKRGPTAVTWILVILLVLVALAWIFGLGR